MGISVTKLAQLTGHRDAVFGMDIGPDGKIYSGGGDGYVVEWDPMASENGSLLATLNRSIYAVRVFENLLLAGSATGEMLAIDLIVKKSLFHDKVHPGGIFDFYADNDRIYIFGENGVVTVLGHDFNQIEQTKLLDDSIRQAVPAGNDEFLLACSDYTVKRIRKQDLSILDVIPAHSNSVFSLAYDQENDRLYTGSRDATIKVWQLDPQKEIKQVNAHYYHVNGLALNDDCSLLLSASLDKTVRIWDTRDMKLLKVVDIAKFGLHSNSVNKVLWIRPNRFISCSDDRTLGHFQVDINAV